MTPPDAPLLPAATDDDGGSEDSSPQGPFCLLQVFLEHAQRTPERLALLFGSERYTYGELAQRVTSFAQALLRRRLKPGERVALFLENSPEFVIAYLGVQYAHGIVVLVNTQYRQVELDHILTDAGARVCVTGAAGAAELAPLLSGLPRAGVAHHRRAPGHAAASLAHRRPSTRCLAEPVRLRRAS